MKANENLLISSVRVVFVDIVGEFFYFPIWWYTRGLRNAFLWFLNSLKRVEYRLAVFLWIKNFFVPMFGQHDWQGRIISVFMRFVQILFRFAMLVIASVFLFVIFLMWVLLPPYVGYSIFLN